MSWTGSENQRSKLRDQCLYPSAKPTPKPVEYKIPAGTSSLMKRVGDKSWKSFKTTRDLTFDATYRATERSLVFFCEGFLLCVTKEKVTIG